MSKSENKTRVSDESVVDFLNSISDPQRRKDCFKILELLEGVSGEKPKMWGSAIIGFGQYHYKYESGREGDWMRIGFSPRKNNITLYFHYFFDDNKDLMSRLGKYKSGKGCLYINKLSDIDVDVLREIAVRFLERGNPGE